MNVLKTRSTLSKFHLSTIAALYMVVLACPMAGARSPLSAVVLDGKVDAKTATNTISGGWYDHKTGDYNNPDLHPYRDNELRTTAESIGPSADTNWLVELIRIIKDLFVGFFRFFFEFLGWAAILVLILLIVGAIYLATGLYIRNYRPLDRGVKSKSVSIDVTRIEELPFEQMQSTTDPLGVCRSLAREGKFDEAILYLYGYQLLALDHARKIHLHKGKTNRMYLRELSTHLQLLSILELTVERFELVYFGKHSLTKQSFLEVWKLLDAFHQLLANTSTASMVGGQGGTQVATGGGS